jgi:hypothetical protein
MSHASKRSPMFEFKRIVINTLMGPLTKQGMTELDTLGRAGWE